MDYYGLPVKRLENRFLSVDVLENAGPRIVRLCLAGSEQNLLAETPDAGWDTPYGKFHLRGGHRLWHAPEQQYLTSLPDDFGLIAETAGDSLRLIGCAISPNYLQKTMWLKLLDDRPGLTIQHDLQNAGGHPMRCAPWAITQLPLGGLATLPFRPPEVQQKGLLPDRHLTLWPYTEINDPRLVLSEDKVCIQARPDEKTFKIGVFDNLGWVSYQYQNVQLTKYFNVQMGQEYPDFGCNVEVFCNESFLELETVAPLVELKPGQQVRHTETWEIKVL
jgi:hypothetical protein